MSEIVTQIVDEWSPRNWSEIRSLKDLKWIFSSGWIQNTKERLEKQLKIQCSRGEIIMKATNVELGWLRMGDLYFISAERTRRNGEYMINSHLVRIRIILIRTIATSECDCGSNSYQNIEAIKNMHFIRIFVWYNTHVIANSFWHTSCCYQINTLNK